MSKDLLSRATEAMRTTALEDDARAASTRARVMASLHKGRVKKRTRIALVLPLAATFAAATALAAGGGRLGHWVQIIQQAIEPAPSVPPTAPTVHKHSASNKPLAVAAPKPVDKTETDEPTTVAESAATNENERPPSPPVDPPAMAARNATPHIVHVATGAARGTSNPASAPLATASAAANGKTAAPTTSTTPPVEAPWESGPAGALYLAAHRAHFVSHDSEAALRAWDAYLAAEPHGRFEPEARYNRALCLLRLGRTAEARDALTPFAEGQYGNYRQREAAALLGK
jgi:hypothetical protein